ncbi:hypothetical protein WJX72_006400 [[Myrmecia] bisecta]|uniref:Uncharacterized protein n=1 Tax=[Myrmecia] bisecta TaxID=41462 RepID=A0AAW1Q1Y2_9CHLO
MMAQAHLEELNFEGQCQAYETLLQLAVDNDHEVLGAVASYAGAMMLMCGRQGPSFIKADAERLMKQAKRYEQVCESYGWRQAVGLIYPDRAKVISTFKSLTGRAHGWARLLRRMRCADRLVFSAWSQSAKARL